MIGDQDRRAIELAMDRLSQVFGDADHLQANTTRALRLFESSGLPCSQFQQAMRAAYSATFHRMADSRRPRLARRMAYWFACLEDQCGRFTHGLTAGEAMRRYSAPGGPGAGSKDASSQREAAR